MEIFAETKIFIEAFLESSRKKLSPASNSEKTLAVAVFYERFRTALDYQEENWIFKNAIARILKRQYGIFGGSPEKLYLNLIDELAWANYVDSEKIPPESKEKAIAIIGHFLKILRYASREHFSRVNVQRLIIDWMACELIEVFKPEEANELLINFTYDSINKSIDRSLIHVTDRDHEILLKLDIYNALFKADFTTGQYWLLKHFSQDWLRESPENIGRNFENYYGITLKYLNHPLRKKYFFVIKKLIAPFILFNNWGLTATNVDETKLSELKYFKRQLMDIYDGLIQKTQRQILQAIIRALIFVFIAKALVALLLELPVELFIFHQVNYLALGINLFLPLVMMVFSIMLIKTPSIKNGFIVSDALTNLFEKGFVTEKKYILREKEPISCLETVFNVIYSFLSLAILVFAAYGLTRIGFNALNIILLFFFVSIVSFLAFRIRLYAKELEMASPKDDFAVSFFDFVTIPFVRIGKYMSDKLRQSNPFIMTIDFLIEAPFKTILKIISSWFRFVRKKKEEIEF